MSNYFDDPTPLTASLRGAPAVYTRGKEAGLLYTTGGSISKRANVACITP